MAVNYSPEEVKKAHEVLYNEGLKMRYQVAGKEYVDRSLKNASNPFAKPMQEVSKSKPGVKHPCKNQSLLTFISTWRKPAGAGFGRAPDSTSKSAAF